MSKENSERNTWKSEMLLLWESRLNSTDQPRKKEFIQKTGGLLSLLCGPQDYSDSSLHLTDDEYTCCGLNIKYSRWLSGSKVVILCFVYPFLLSVWNNLGVREWYSPSLFFFLYLLHMKVIFHKMKKTGLMVTTLLGREQLEKVTNSPPSKKSLNHLISQVTN